MAAATKPAAAEMSFALTIASPCYNIGANRKKQVYHTFGGTV
jgi:hypothetical protein